jgi:hypothetical protein
MEFFSRPPTSTVVDIIKKAEFSTEDVEKFRDAYQNLPSNFTIEEVVKLPPELWPKSRPVKVQMLEMISASSITTTKRSTDEIDSEPSSKIRKRDGEVSTNYSAKTESFKRAVQNFSI